MNYLTLVTMLTIVNAAWADDKTTDAAPRDPYFRCSEPASRIYNKTDSNDAMDVTLITDYATLNQRPKDLRGVVAVLVQKHKSQKMEFVPVLLETRGASRRESCSAKPFRMKFVSQDVSTQIEKDLETAGVKDDSPDYIVEFYKRFLAANLPAAPKNPQEKEALAKGAFSKLGNDIKVVTHCGTANWNMLGGKTPAEQDTHLLSEYYLYEILGKLNTTVEAVRLAHFLYLDPAGKPIYHDPDASGNPVTYKLGFFREPPSSLAKRCGLLNHNPTAPREQGPAYPGQGGHPVGNGAADEISRFETEFINKFINNSDYGFEGHNTNDLYDETGKKYYGAYDFDLSGVFTEGYNMGDLKANLAGLLDWLKAYPKYAGPVIKQVLSKRDTMRSILQNSLLEDRRKQQMLDWFDMYTKALSDRSN